MSEQSFGLLLMITYKSKSPQDVFNGCQRLHRSGGSIDFKATSLPFTVFTPIRSIIK